MLESEKTPRLHPQIVADVHFSPSPNMRNRPTGLPELGEMLRSPRELEGMEKSTPYRLPKLGSDSYQSEAEKMVWSRHGFQHVPQRSLDFIAFAGKNKISPSTVIQEVRRSNLCNTHFQQAMIVPASSTRQSLNNSLRHKSTIDPVSQSLPDDSILEDYLGQNVSAYTPPPPLSRIHTPPKSSNSIHWTLSPYKNLNFDKKGKGRVQGPYSREFTVTCSAPVNWLRMKLGRNRSTVV